jgi:hypothetical protein
MLLNSKYRSKENMATCMFLYSRDCTWPDCKVDPSSRQHTSTHLRYVHIIQKRLYIEMQLKIFKKRGGVRLKERERKVKYKIWM